MTIMSSSIPSHTALNFFFYYIFHPSQVHNKHSPSGNINHRIESRPKIAQQVVKFACLQIRFPAQKMKQEEESAKIQPASDSIVRRARRKSVENFHIFPRRTRWEEKNCISPKNTEKLFSNIASIKFFTLRWCAILMLLIWNVTVSVPKKRLLFRQPETLLTAGLRIPSSLLHFLYAFDPDIAAKWPQKSFPYATCQNGKRLE